MTRITYCFWHYRRQAKPTDTNQKFQESECH